MDPEADLAVIKEWRKKGYEHSNDSNDALLLLFAKGFESIAVFASSSSDSSSILHSIESLESERTIALKYEKTDSDVLRQFAFGIIEVYTLLMKVLRGKNSNPVEQHEAALSVINDWRSKSFALSSKSNDLLHLLFAKGFEAIADIASATDNASILRSIESLESERTLALKYESGSFDALRFLSLGFIKTFNLLMRIQIKKSNSEEQTTDVNCMNDQISNLPPLKIKNEPIDDFDYGTFDLYPPLPIKKEEPVDTSEVVFLADQAFYAMDAMSNEEIPENKVFSNINSGGNNSVYNDQEMDLNSPINMPRGPIVNKTELECPKCEYRTRSACGLSNHLQHKHCNTLTQAGLAFLCDCGKETQSFHHVRKCDIANVTLIHKRDESIRRTSEQKESTVNEKNRDRPSRSVPRPIKNANSMRNSVEDSKLVPRLKTPKKRPINISMSDDEEVDLNATINMSRVPIVNKTELECPECEYRSRSLTGFVFHLSRMHSNTPTQAGLAFLCDCGNESQSKGHVRKCDIANFTLIRKRDGDITRTDDAKESIANEKNRDRPSRSVPRPPKNSEPMKDSVEGFKLVPRSKTPKKTPRKRDISVSDDEEVDLNATINMSRGIVNKTELECPECEYRTRSVTGYVIHLDRKHSTTPAQAGLSFLCDCGIETQSPSHVRSCNIANVTLIRKRDGTISRADDEKESTVNSKNRDIPSRSVSKPLKNAESMKDSVEGSKLVPRSKTPNKRPRNISMSDDEEVDLNSAMNMSRVPIVNKTDLNCPECEYRSRSLMGFITHIQRKHFKTVVEADLAFLCECGHESQSSHHIRKCDIANVSVIRKKDETIRKTDDQKVNKGRIGESSNHAIVTKKESTVNEENRDRPSRSVSKPPKKTESMEEGSKLVPRSKTPKKTPRKTPRKRVISVSDDEEMDLNSTINMSRVPFVNKTDLECPECEYRTRSVNGFVIHLGRNHFTTPAQAGLTFLCDCGHKTQSNSHVSRCAIANFILIRKRDDTISRTDDEKDSVESSKLVPRSKTPKKTPRKRVIRVSDDEEMDPNATINMLRVPIVNKTDLECPKCEYRTRSLNGFVLHLERKHFTTPTQAGLAFHCDCGNETQSNGHVRKCAIANFTIVRKRDGPIIKTDDEKANEGGIGKSSDHTIDTTKDSAVNGRNGERPPRSVSKPLRYADSMENSVESSKLVLRPKAPKTPKKMKRDNSMSDDEEMDLNSTINMSQVSIANRTNLECPECEYRSRSALGFIRHLQFMHSKTIAQAGLAFICDCGTETQSHHHVRTCEMANVTIIRKKEVAPTESLDLSDFSDSEPLMKWKSKSNSKGRTDKREANLISTIDNSMPTGTAMDIPTDSSENTEVKNSKRVLRIDPKPKKFTDDSHDSLLTPQDNLPMSKSKKTNDKSMEDSECVTGSSFERKRKIDESMSIGQELAPMGKKSRTKGKQNQTDLECPDNECEYRTRSVAGWVQHLKSKHSTNPAQAGLAMACDCGTVTYSDGHVRKCAIANVTLIHKEVAPIGSLDPSDSKPLMSKSNDNETSNTREEDPVSTNDNSMAKETAMDIPTESSENAEVKYNEGVVLCDPMRTKIVDESDDSLSTPHDHQPMSSQKLNESVQMTPKCVLCENYPRTASGYAAHLSVRHKSTLAENNIFIKCSCGMEVRMMQNKYTHGEECDPHQFTLHKVEDE